jgi:hypothetical protein
VRVAVVLGAVALVACGKSTPGASTPDGSKAPDAGALAASAAPATDSPLDDLWKRAKDGDADDLARLADREGEAGLRARAERDPSLRLTAIRALAEAPEPGVFLALPFLARAAAGPDETEATAALESTIDLAARPRRATDPEDAAELKEGCDLLLAFARDPKDGGAVPRARRVKAIRALRMLADRGCVDPAQVPQDLDAK